jgi:hypothetical protein
MIEGLLVGGDGWKLVRNGPRQKYGQREGFDEETLLSPPVWFRGRNAIFCGDIAVLRVEGRSASGGVEVAC